MRDLQTLSQLIGSCKSQDVVEAIQQDAPERRGTVVDLQSWTTLRMRHASRVKAAMLLAVIYWAALPLSLAVAAAHWLWKRFFGEGTSATTNSGGLHGPSQRSASRGTALVSGVHLPAAAVNLLCWGITRVSDAVGLSASGGSSRLFDCWTNAPVQAATRQRRCMCAVTCTGPAGG